ncbi:MAG: zf-HC2 domain-containing protein [Ignavibacteriaceae bacterium]
MKCKEVQKYLNEYIDGLLTADKNKIVAEHISDCKKCRNEIEELVSIIEEAKLIPNEITPKHDFWDKISERIGATKLINAKIFSLDSILPKGNHYRLKFIPSRIYSGRRIAVAGSLVTAVIAALLFLFFLNNVPGQYLRVEKLAGIPLVGNDRTNTNGMIKLGDWIITDASSEARLLMPSVGEVDIFPNSRVKLIESKPDEYRILLEKGSIDAKIMAPPKVFFVETPSATAIDLGCRYRLEVEENGHSLLHVLNGKVAFAFSGRESLVPAGAFCETRVSAGPGIPYYKTASRNLKDALYKIDFENGGEDQIDIVLCEATKDDALSLWHLLKRSDRSVKPQVYSKIDEMFEIPPEITLAGLINGNEKMFDDLWKVLGIGKRRSLL